MAIKRMKKLFFLMLPALIIGVASLAGAAAQEDVIGFWTFDLRPGFNLVNFPVLPDTPTPASVIGGSMGEVEILAWDARLGQFRSARFDPQTNNWSGNLFLVDRGTAYWINLIGADGHRRLVVAGHPEQQLKFRWNRMGEGWQMFAPTIGRETPFAEIPPDASGDLAIAWDADRMRFELAEALSDRWQDNPAFNSFKPDQAYFIHLSRKTAFPFGPQQVWIEELQRRERNGSEPGRDGGGNEHPAYLPPPWPVVVGNIQGLPVCNPDGSICAGSLTVNVMRERLRLAPGGGLEPYAEIFATHRVSMNRDNPGRFRLALTVGMTAQFINPGDRVYLEVRGPGGTSTQSTSFEVPESDRFIPDVNFPDPLSTSGSAPAQPVRFSLSAPFPNPFNSRFMIEFSAPAAAPVQYRLYDLQGRVAFSAERPFTAGFHRLTIGAGDLPAGIYLLELSTGNYKSFAKVAHVK
ncbi:MAG: T9SS type A sorting domain-containing protein [Calditrichota bacterium]